MKPNTERPQACVIDDEVHVFVGGFWQAMALPAAEKFNNDVASAIAQAKASTSEGTHADQV